MALALSDLRQQTQGAWLQLGWPRRIVILLVSTALVGALISVAIWARTPSYRVVYSNLTEEDASAIVAQLNEHQIPYLLEAGGTRILAPDSMVEDARLQVASARLPSSGSGFELFDKTQLGATDYAQRINYQRAIEGELARTIARLSPIEQARVHLAMPAPSLYLDREKPATAAVMVKLKLGQRLTESQIRGVAYLVAGSVPGLKLENLNIVDTSGAVLSGSLTKGTSGPQTGEQSAAQRAVESRIEQDTLAMLELVTGRGKATVRVSATMNWDQEETSTETYQPAGDKPLVRNAKELSENYDRANAPTGGVPGAASNLPTYQQPSDGAGQGAYVRKESTTSYELTKSTARVVKAPGSVARLSVAVALDNNQQVSAEYLEQIRGLVAAATGINPGRGDTLAISSLPFSTKETEDQQQTLAVMQEQQQREMLIETVKAGSTAVGPTLLLGMLYLVLRRMRRSVPDFALQTNVRAAGTTVDLVSAPERTAAAALASGLPGAAQRALGDQGAAQVAAVEELGRLARTQPGALAQALTAWLEEDSRRARP